VGDVKGAPLGVALKWVVGHRDRVDAAREHDLLQRVERAGRVVRRAEESDPSCRTLLLHPVEVLPPGDQVVYLLQVDATTEELELSLELPSALRHRAGPDLCRHQGIRAAIP